jgi:preprotein translocase subunit SecD
MSLAKKMFTSVRVLILLVALVLAALAIQPSFDQDGVAIRGVAKNSSAALASIQSPGPDISPTQREVIKSVNNQPVIDVKSYNDIVSKLSPEDQAIIKTTKKVSIINKVQNTYLLDVKASQEDPAVAEDLGLTVYSKPNNNIRKGLDLEGGTRVLLQPQEQVSDEELSIVVENIKQRLNVYGVSDVVVRTVKDFDGNAFISVEIAGVNKDEVRELLARQGKFEAKVGNDTVFRGGNDITHVCRTPDCSGLDTQRGCGQTADNMWVCSFQFAITLSPDAAKAQAAATEDLEVLVDTNGEGFLSENLTLYLDDQTVDELRISSDLKGSETTQIRITGSGAGTTRESAQVDAFANMKKLQTVLITGSLPVKLEIVKTDAISPQLGESFVKNIMLVGLLSMIAVALVVFFRYLEWRVAVPIIITMISEVVILLGIASLIGWRLDLAAIAGILIAVGTGVDDQIIIADETMRKERVVLSWKEKLSRAFFIIMAAYFATVVAMLPLWFAGAGILKGFALTTILGVSIGVFITRPAYARFVELLSETKKHHDA